MTSKGTIIRYLFFLLMFLSIAITYYTKVIIDDYEIVGNEDGLPTLDEE